MIATYLLIGCVVGIALACFVIVLLLEHYQAQFRPAQKPDPADADRTWRGLTK